MFKHKKKIMLGSLIIAIAGVTLYHLKSTKSAQVVRYTPLTNQAITQPKAPSSTLAPQQNVALSISAITSAKAIPTAHTETFASPLERIQAIQNKSQLQQALLRDHAEFDRYPNYNKRIETPEQDPITQKYAIDERISESEDSYESMRLWTEQKYYLPGQKIRIFAQIFDENREPTRANFGGQLIFNENKEIQTLVFTPTENDQIYRSELTLDILSEKPDYGIYKALVINDKNDLADSVTFTLSEPSIRLTGEYTEQINENGSLIIDTEVQVSAAGRFYAQASLYGSTAESIGSAQTANELKPGKHWLRFTYDAQLIADAGAAGPYIVKHVELAKTGIPISRLPLENPNFITDSYPLEQFSRAAASTTQSDKLN